MSEDNKVDASQINLQENKIQEPIKSLEQPQSPDQPQKDKQNEDEKLLKPNQFVWKTFVRYLIFSILLLVIVYKQLWIGTSFQINNLILESFDKNEDYMLSDVKTPNELYK